MAVQINLESYAKPWRPGIYPKSTTVIHNNQLWILNNSITGLFSSSDFLAEVANGDWIGRYTTEADLSTKEDLLNKATDFTVINDTLYPSVQAVKEQLDSKVDKVSTTGVERSYIINADGSQGTKPTSDFNDVLEFADLSAFPTTGETGKIYLALDTNNTYRWSGTAYVQIGGKRNYYININLSTNIAGSTNWYILNNQFALTSTAVINPTNNFANINVQTVSYSVPFACKIKAAFIKGFCNSGATNVRFCIIKSKGESSNLITNSDIIADKTFNTYLTPSYFTYKFSGTDIDPLVNIDENSEIRIALFNNNVVSNLFGTTLVIQFEEL